MNISSVSKDGLKATGIYGMPVTVMGKTVNRCAEYQLKCNYGSRSHWTFGCCVLCQKEEICIWNRWTTISWSLNGNSISRNHTSFHTNANQDGNFHNRGQQACHKPQFYGYNFEPRISTAWRRTWMGSTKSCRSHHNGGLKLQSHGYEHSKRYKDGCIRKHPWRDNSAYLWMAKRSSNN